MGIVLASRSPRRRQLLEQMGLRDFRIVCSDADETASPGLTPPALVEALSARKAAAVQHAAAAGDLIIAADTVVALDGRVLGKPADGPDAFAMLSALSGRRHQVYTGLTVVCGAQRLTEHEVTAVTFRSLSSAEICAYIATGEPMDKAGAYGIQGRGALFVEGIEGDYYNVMGLPVCRLGRILARLGVDCARLWSEL
ncbi:Maf family protein [Flavonifractor sp. DFI.6.63]|uniref:dTTP/UTP pyrophosphatase n=1 Tax=Lawsonibacter hominis TaxID=2763053 RepID=A0A8J6J5R5_9FIRM|nr:MULTISPECIES: Maf family protein [Oscillospiraceae]MBC5734263.1 septum formation inhibitor Maf [Lawsonibacter hominis]MBS1384349.1 septum formation inhibitor Maf [Flavonifractor sp.]MCQ5027937.1 Maf family protein [Flavonifractor sp. DFI.6.63]MDU2195053.1 Maf family protein [Clostridiales bacterium]